MKKNGSQKIKTQFSVIIPVLYEIDNLQICLKSLSELVNSESVEVIIVDGDSNGSTISSLTENNKWNIQLKTVISQPGRAIQMNMGTRLASGDTLIFLHVDTQLPSSAFSRISETLSDVDVVAGAFDLSIDSDRISLKLISIMASFRSRLNQIPYGDQAIFIKRDYFLKHGGYADMPIMEDVDLMRSIKRRGDKIHILKEKVKTSARRWLNEGIIYCTLRNWSLATLFYLGISPVKLKRYYK